MSIFSKNGQPEWLTRAMHSVPLQFKDGAASDLSKLEADGHVNLVKGAQKVGINLSKQDLTGFRGEVRLYVDHSPSMQNDRGQFPSLPFTEDYTNGNVAALVEMALSFGLQVDADGKIPVIAFDNRLYREVPVTKENYLGVVERDIFHREEMNGTRFVPICRDLLTEAQKTEKPIMAIIASDGNPSDGREAEELFCELAAYPVFVKFLTLRPVTYLTDLDENLDDSRRLLDNINTQVVTNPKDMTLMQIAELMTAEIGIWTKAALDKGTLTRV